jgi:hypothetical protein
MQELKVICSQKDSFPYKADITESDSCVHEICALLSINHLMALMCLTAPMCGLLRLEQSIRLVQEIG